LPPRVAGECVSHRFSSHWTKGRRRLALAPGRSLGPGACEHPVAILDGASFTDPVLPPQASRCRSSVTGPGSHG
jgi:hypothetical protein